MTKKNKIVKNWGMITLLQIISICLGVFFWWTIVGIPFGLLGVFILSLFSEYEYTCDNCGSRTGRDSYYCYHCEEEFK